jgi:AraC-like DNA-binding protein
MERHDEGMPCAARAVPYSVRHAVLYMRHAMHRRLTAAEVANAAGVPERSLHRHFLHFLGQAPLVHFKTMRLAAARTALLASGAENATVTDIATQFGFVHLGRFSLDYRLRFGESPSATLARARAAATESRERARARPACPAIRRPVPALVVMPIRTAAAGMQERLFAEGLAEKLASALAQAHGFSVRPARAEPDLKSQPPSAHYCLVGQISRLSEHRIRAVLRLLDLSRTVAISGAMPSTVRWTT